MKFGITVTGAAQLECIHAGYRTIQVDVSWLGQGGVTFLFKGCGTSDGVLRVGEG